MTIFFGVLLALFVFSVIVFFHELGHFLAARKTGVRVEEF
jgi:regulator of sigma E protease